MKHILVLVLVLFTMSFSCIVLATTDSSNTGQSVAITNNYDGVLSKAATYQVVLGTDEYVLSNQCVNWDFLSSKSRHCVICIEGNAFDLIKTNQHETKSDSGFT